MQGHKSLRPRPKTGSRRRTEIDLLNLGEDNRQRKKSKGLDEGQAENQQELDAGASARVASKRFCGRGDCPALAETAKPGSEPHAEANANWRHIDYG